MRSPGASRMIQTRTRSLSETSVDPTQPLLLRFSCSNSAAMAGGQADFSDRSVDLFIMVRAMVFLQTLCDRNIENLRRLGKLWKYAFLGEIRDSEKVRAPSREGRNG